jgi:Glycine/D-amino acid oxidases (deaminating)
LKIVILGSGVIGVTTAYFLAKAGHEVEVVDRQLEAGLETSFANAGQISPGYSSPWAGPGIPLKAVKWLLMKHGPLVIRPKADPAMWRWLLQMLRNCTAARYAINKARMVPIAEYSRDCLRALRAETGIEYENRSLGTLQLFRTQQQLDGIGKDIEVLKQFGVEYQVLDRAGCQSVEPALSRAQAPIAGGLRLPQDETGNCRIFTQKLAAMAERLGVNFTYGVAVKEIVAEGGAVTGVRTSAGLITADAYVVALGSYSPLLLRSLGIRIPVYPVKGYSLSVPISDAGGAPVSTVMDETYKVAITRLGDSIRVGGTAEVAGYDLTLRQSRRATLEHSLSGLFPFGGDPAAGSFWCGLRPMTPDGPPIIGPAPVRKLYLNTGHGTLGWTMACGSGRALADLLSGRKSEIDLSPLSVTRFA